MKQFLLLLFFFLIITSCKETDNEAEKEKVKIYVIATTDVYLTGETVPTIEISGTNIKTVSNVTGTQIIEANYPKGETQTVTVKATDPNNIIYLDVSKTVDLNNQGRILYKTGKGIITANFVAQ